ncbi:MAG: hypothetical protein NTU53_15095 [Planctomycetota bacterium]|nr:hypothetical protein [Planctomycetota bacterium]
MAATKRPTSAPSQQLQLRPAPFRRHMTLDGPATLATWRRYSLHRNAADEKALVDHYLPLCHILVYPLKRAKPESYWEDEDTLISDAALALLQTIRRHHHIDRCYGFRVFATGRIRCIIHREITGRMWGHRRGYERLRVVAQARARLIQEHGRMPTSDELTAALAGLITNPDIAVGKSPKWLSPSQIDSKSNARRLRGAIKVFADRSAQSPDAPLIERQTMRLALKGLKGDEPAGPNVSAAGWSKRRSLVTRWACGVVLASSPDGPCARPAPAGGWPIRGSNPGPHLVQTSPPAPEEEERGRKPAGR